MQALLSRLVSRFWVDNPPNPLRTQNRQYLENDDPSYSMQGGVIGFVFYWLAFAIPIVVYGSNTLFFFLYTWPFFLALMPVAVLIGIVFSTFLRGSWFKTTVASGVCIIGMFWSVFSFLSGW